MQTIKPMLCESSQPFDDLNYIWEIKWDGERAIVFLEKGKVFIQNRNGKDITYRYPEIQAMADGKEAILDGEIVALNETGKSDFMRLAQRSHLQKKFDIELRAQSIPVTFMAFDCLAFAGEDLTKQPLMTRREILFKEFNPCPPVFLWSMFLEKEGRGTVLFEQARALDLEGIVGKRIDSPYLEGRRSPYWKKVKNQKTRDMVFTKYTVNPAGIRVVDQDGIAVQVSGAQASRASAAIDEHGSCLIEVRYLYVTENGRLFQPTCKEVKGI